MLSTKIIVLTAALLCLSVVASVGQQLRVKKVFSRQDLILDHEPLLNNSLLYATCKPGIYRQDLKCQVVLEKFNSCRIVSNETCQVSLTSKAKGRRFGQHFQLVQLPDDRVIFAYASENANDAKSKDYSMRLRVIQMATCREFPETSVDFGAEEPKLYFVSYKDTFDVFYENETLCGGTMCGQTHDASGRLISGPLPSYLSTSFFRTGYYHPTVYPAKFQSSAMGHYVVFDKIRLVSAYAGRTTVLLDPPTNYYTLAPPRNENGSYGFCSAVVSIPYYVNCKVFDARGNKTIDTNVTLEHEVTGTMRMHILDNGSGFLLLVRQCDSEYRTCRKTVDKFAYHIVKVRGNGRYSKPRELEGIECERLQEGKIELSVSSRGEACVNAVCYGRSDDGLEKHLDLRSRCVSFKYQCSVHGDCAFNNQTCKAN